MSQPNTTNSSESGSFTNNSCSTRRIKRRGRRRRFFRFFGFIALLWITASVSYNHGHKIVGFVKMSKLSKEMGLTWQQKDQLQDTFFDAFQKTYAQRKEARKIKRDLYRLIDKEGLTQKELNTFISQSMKKLEKMALEHSASLLKARNVLTPYQRKVLIVRLQQMERKKNRWRSHRRYRRYSEADYYNDLQPRYAQPKPAKPETVQPKEMKPKKQSEVQPSTSAPRPTKLSQRLP